MNLSWLEISKSALLHNISHLRTILPKRTKLWAMIKANAYGHGILEVSSIIKDQVDGLISYHFDDLITLRKQRINVPLLCLGRVFPSQIKEAIKRDIEIAVSTFDILLAAQKIRTNNKLKIHLCIDSGLGRDGFVEKELGKIIEILADKKFGQNIEIVGLFTHFAAADDQDFDDYTQSQMDVLEVWKKSLADIGLKPKIHASASSATLRKIATDLDAVRVGLALYGMSPFEKITNKNLQPVLSWKAVVSEVKELKKGSAISYGCTHILARDSKVAVLPIGYFDGISRLSSSKSQVLVNGKKCAQIGRVTMNIIMIDVTDIADVQEGDVATIIGCDTKEEITADDWASWSQTSNYEVTTRLSALLLRRVTE